MTDQLATIWCDRDRWYFIANAEVVEAAEPMYVSGALEAKSETPYADAEKVGLQLSSLACTDQRFIDVVTPDEFYTELAHEMIDNTKIDNLPSRTT
eukprot:scaffold87706_cov72-Attheya_sp.AAC.2